MKTVALMALVIATTLLSAITQGATNTPRSQVTTGPNSPIVSDNSGVVIINLGSPDQSVALHELRNANRQLAVRNDPVSSKLRASITRGDFAGASKMVAQELANAEGQLEQVALLKYVDGMLLLLDRRPAEAERSIRAAASLQPNNCTYMALQGSLLVKLDRMTEAALLAQDTNPAVAKCLKAAAPLDRATLLFVSVSVAAQERDAGKARSKLELMDMTLAQFALDRSLDQLEIKISMICEFPRLARAILGVEEANTNFQNYIDRCQKLNARLGKHAANYSKYWIAHNYDISDRNPASAEEKFQILSDALAALDSMPVLPNIGIDSLSLHFKRAETLSNRGFHRLWQMKDVKGAHEDYLLAYQTITPLLAVQRPEIWITYYLLGFRILHFNEIFPETKLAEVRPENIRRDISILTKGAPVDNTMDFCDALFWLESLAQRVSVDLDTGLVQAIDKRRDECLSSMLDKTSLNYSYQHYQSQLMLADRAIRANNLVRAEASMTEALNTAESLYGFPMWMESSRDTWTSRIGRAAIRQKLGKDREAEQDFRAAVELSRNAKNDFMLATSLLYLASQIMQGDGTRLQAAQGAADEATAIRYNDLKHHEPPSCTSLWHYAKAQQLAALIAVDSDIYSNLLAHLDRFASTIEYVSRCSDVETTYSQGRNTELNMSRALPLLMITDASMARNALPKDSYVTVREAAIASSKALNDEIARYDAMGVKRTSLPILSSLLSIAGSPAPAQ